MTARLSFLFVSLWLACMGMAQAERADRNKPMNIEADALRHDELQQTSVFTGRVVLTKGTIVLRGTRLEMRQDSEGYQHAAVTGSAGARAFFRQKRDSQPGQGDEYVEGEGETIEYDGRSDQVKIVRRAELRRYRGASLADEITGAVIVYSSLTDRFSVEGAATPAQAAAGDEAPEGTGGARPGRVRAVLVPQDTASNVPSEGSAPALRPSPALGGARP